MGAVIRAHWKKFVWMWLFPPAFLASVFVPAFARSPFAFFLTVDAPVFFLCFYMASKPVRSREVTRGQGMVLVVLVPFAIWVAMILGFFGLAALSDSMVPH